MNAIEFLSTQPWVDRLGATLLHFFWQGILIAALYAAARHFAPLAARPGVRYLLACAALAAMAAAPLLTWALVQPAATGRSAAPFTAFVPAAGAAARAAVDLSAAYTTGISRALPTPFLSWVVAAWLLGALLLWLRLLGGWVLAERLRSRLVRAAPADWRQALERLKRDICVSRPVRLLVSPLVQAPTVVGWLRPVILAPVGALAGLPPDQVEALLLHELAHIRRHDYLVNAVARAVEALLFYHPAVWWISGHVRAEREICCDDLAVSVSGDPIAYARALAGLESARPPRLHAALAASGGALAHRIARLIGQSRPAPRAISAPGFAAAAVLLALTGLAIFAQPAARPKFEVASVKPSQNPGFQMIRPLPGRFTADASVLLLMQNAYSVQPFQIVDGPPAIASERYLIDAKTGGNAPRSQMFLMLQSLLEDRFHLKTHRETRRLPVYSLVAAKGGLKLTPSKEGGCVEPPPDAPLDWQGGRMRPPGMADRLTMRCGVIGIALEPFGARMLGGKVTAAELARTLSTALGCSVIDRTGYSGLFDVDLGFVTDETTAAMPPPPPGSDPGPPDRNHPPITTALQEKLGLRLESSKGPVEVIVVDHLEQPTAN